MMMTCSNIVGCDNLDMHIYHYTFIITNRHRAAPPAGAAIYAYRSGGLPSLRLLGITKLLTRYEGYVEAPKSSKKSQIPLTFEFPSDWLQLDKLGGGVQYGETLCSFLNAVFT